MNKISFIITIVIVMATIELLTIYYKLTPLLHGVVILMGISLIFIVLHAFDNVPEELITSSPIKELLTKGYRYEGRIMPGVAYSNNSGEKPSIVSMGDFADLYIYHDIRAFVVMQKSLCITCERKESWE